MLATVMSYRGSHPAPPFDPRYGFGVVVCRSEDCAESCHGSSPMALLLQRELSAFRRSLLFAGKDNITALVGKRDMRPISAGPVSSHVLPVWLTAPLHPTRVFLIQRKCSGRMEIPPAWDARPQSHWQMVGWFYRLP